MRIARLGIFALVVAWGCSDDEGLSLTVDLRTDHVPGTEFTSVDTTLEIDGRPLAAIPAGASASHDFISGRRIAEYTGLPPGSAVVRVSLRDAAGAMIASRATRLELGEDTGMVVVVSRACASISCPGAMDSADATECLNGLCVAATCRSGSETGCGGASCEVGASCTSGVDCIEPTCSGIACLLVPRDSRCAATERCDVERGCVPNEVGDAGPADTGPADTGPVDAGPDVTTGLVAHWDCDAIGASELADVTGNGHDGRCGADGCPVTVTGRIGNACSFDSTTPNRIRVPYDPAFSATGGYTIALWFQASEFFFRSIFAKPVGSEDANSYQIEIRDPDMADFEVVFTTSSDAVGLDFLRYADPTLVSRWVHVVTTWDGTAKRLYVDGVLVGSATATTLAWDDSDLVIGYDLNGGVAVFDYDGLLDDIRFYDRVLTVSQISALADP